MMFRPLLALVPTIFAGVLDLPAQAAAATLGVDDVLVLRRASDRGGRARLFAKLRKTKVSVNLEEVAPGDLARYLTVASGSTTNFVVMTKEEIAPLTVQLDNVPLTTVMDLAQRLGGVRFVFTPGAVLLQHPSEVKEYTFLRTYDVRAATMRIPDRAGPELGFTSGEGDAFADEDDEGGASISGFSTDKVIDMLRNNVLPESWDREGITISEHRGVLSIRQTEKGHREVTRLLVQLGAIRAPRVIVRPRAPAPAGRVVRKPASRSAGKPTIRR